MPRKEEFLNHITPEISHAYITAVVDRTCSLQPESFKIHLINGKLAKDLSNLHSCLNEIKNLSVERRTSLIYTLSLILNFLKNNKLEIPSVERRSIAKLIDKIKRILRRLLDEDITISLTIPRNGQGVLRRASFRKKRDLEG